MCAWQGHAGAHGLLGDVVGPGGSCARHGEGVVWGIEHDDVGPCVGGQSCVGCARWDACARAEDPEKKRG